MDGNQQPNDQNGPWQYRPEGSPVVQSQQVGPQVLDPRSVAVPPTGASGGISWTASEFVAHHKSGGWYAILVAGAIGLAVIAWFVSSKDTLTPIVVLVGAAMLGTLAARKPRELAYRLDEAGLTIGARFYHYSMFRSFAIMSEGAFASIVFMPLKRFAPLTTIYYDPRDEEKIVALLADRLPMEERKRDPIDSLMWRIRF